MASDVHDDRWMLRLLLVEDDPIEARTICDTIERYEGIRFEIEAASSVEDALHRLVDGLFDAMVLDLSLPEGNGLTTLLRAKEAAPTIPIVVITDEDDESLALDSIGLGAQEYLVKSDVQFLPRMVLNAIHRHRILTELRSARQREHHLATHDALTSLVNRYSFIERLRESIARAERSGEKLGLLFIDLDDFKTVNDTLGHPAGDQILRAFAERLNRTSRRGDPTARFGGDEFTLLAHGATEAGLEVLAQRVRSIVDQPFDLMGEEFSLGMSIGIALFPDDGRDPDVLIRNADTAMYQAKARGRNRHCFYARGMNAVVAERFRVANQIRLASQRDELLLHYQPQIDTSTGEVLALEALVRWRDSDGGLAAPSTFIPAAERLGLIDSIGEWVLRQACRDASRWRRRVGSGLRLSVNVSQQQLAHPGFRSLVEGILAETGLEPADLELEITESLILDEDAPTLEALRRLRRSGVRLALDDFGTGYSNLRCLQTLSVDTLKIERTFVECVPSNLVDEGIVRAIVALAGTVGSDVVAEGIETREQLAALRRLGCERMQGFLFQEPIPSAKVDELLAASTYPWAELVGPEPGDESRDAP